MTTNDVIKLMYELGSEDFKEQNGELIFQSVCHSSEKYKLYYYPDTKRFHCYSNCNNMSVYDVIMRVKETDFRGAFNFLKGFIGGYNRTIVGFGNNAPRKKVLLEEVEVPTIEPIKKQFLYNMYSNQYIKEWLQEGITGNAMEKFKIRYDEKGERAIIPHFDINNKCVGVRVRNFNELELLKGKPKYMPLWYDDICYSHPLGGNLYGLNIAKDNIKKYKKVIITEGEKSCLLYESYYPNNNLCVSLCGSNFSNVHKKMLLDLGVKEIILCLDRQYEDENSIEGKEWREKIHKNLSNLSPYCKVSYVWDTDENNLLGYKDSPLDQGKEVFEKLIKSRITIKE